IVEALCCRSRWGNTTGLALPIGLPRPNGAFCVQTLFEFVWDIASILIADILQRTIPINKGTGKSNWSDYSVRPPESRTAYGTDVSVKVAVPPGISAAKVG